MFQKTGAPPFPFWLISIGISLSVTLILMFAIPDMEGYKYIWMPWVITNSAFNPYFYSFHGRRVRMINMALKQWNK